MSDTSSSEESSSFSVHGGSDSADTVSAEVVLGRGGDGAVGGDHVALEDDSSAGSVSSSTDDKPVRRRNRESKPDKKGTKAVEKKDGADDDVMNVDITEHMLTLGELADELDVDLARGLKQAERERRLEVNGKNQLTPPKTEPEVVKLIKELTGFFAILLWAGSILSLVAFLIDPLHDQSNLYIGSVLAIVVLGTGIFSYFQNKKSDDVMKTLSKRLAQTAIVYIHGEKGPREVEVSDLVVGDIIKLDTGMKVPADVRITETSSLKVDNSSLTGEPDSLPRTVEMTDPDPLETKNIAFSGTSATAGTARAVVIRTGDNTAIGKIARVVSQTDSGETPIQVEIKFFITIISVVAITLGVVFFVIGLILSGGDIITNVVFMIGIIVANVPEGLLATVTVSLTLTAQRMARKAVLVKNLKSVETLGSTSVICSDKTGTLTQNIMTVSHLWYGCNMYNAPTSTQDATFDRENATFQSLLAIATLCNKAVFEGDAEDSGEPIQKWKTQGDASESALIKFAHPLNHIIKSRKKNPKVFEIPFNSSNKFQVSVHIPHKSSASKNLLLVMKGAPERILDRCSTISIDGEAVPITQEHLDAYDDAYDELGGRGERVLGFCEFHLDSNKYNADYEFDPNPNADGEFNFPMTDLTFVGLISMIDPPRPAVPRSVRLCQEAGIRVIMVTGDHPKTAKAIAQKVNIVTHKTVTEVAEEHGVSEERAQRKYKREIDAIVIPGSRLLEIGNDQREWDNILKHRDIVFARTSPQQKLIIVNNVQKRNAVVAVTGDGVNDSPALKQADIGVAMGITGTEVAKDAADMILTDDNFASIVRGVEEGRLIFDNLKKSIAYTLTSNIPEIAPFLFFITVQIPLPLSTVLILCVDLGTDLLPAISFAYEKAESDIMKKRPRDKVNDHLVNAKLIGFAYLQIGILQAMAGFYAYFIVLGHYGFPIPLLFGTGFQWASANHLIAGTNSILRLEVLYRAQTAYFCSIVVVQWADLLIAKTRKLSLFQQGFTNKIAAVGLLSETLLAIVVAYVPFINIVLLTRQVLFVHLFLPALPFSVLILVYDEIRKAIIRKYPGGFVDKYTYW